MSMTPNDPRHGTSNGYLNLSCRCQRCRDAFAKQHYDYMHRNPEQQEKHRRRMRERYAANREKKAS